MAKLIGEVRSVRTSRLIPSESRQDFGNQPRRGGGRLHDVFEGHNVVMQVPPRVAAPQLVEGCGMVFTEGGSARCAPASPATLEPRREFAAERARHILKDHARLALRAEGAGVRKEAGQSVGQLPGWDMVDGDGLHGVSTFRLR